MVSSIVDQDVATAANLEVRKPLAAQAGPSVAQFEEEISTFRLGRSSFSIASRTKSAQVGKDSTLGSSTRVLPG